MKTTCTMLLLCLMLAACGNDEGSDTPEEAATKFIEALQSGDREDVYAAVHGREGESFKKVDERLKFNRWDYCNIEEFKVIGSELDGNRAKVTVMTTRDVGGVMTEQQELVVCVQEHKKWKETMSASSKLFLPVSKEPE